MKVNNKYLKFLGNLEKENKILIKMIDFDRVYENHKKEPDENVLFGLNNILKIFESL
jgi:hypothetical protein